MALVASNNTPTRLSGLQPNARVGRCANRKVTRIWCLCALSTPVSSTKPQPS